MRSAKTVFISLATALMVLSAGVSSPARAQQAAPLPISDLPLYLAQALPPLNMLVMGKDHKNYYEAYNDASDLDGDGAIDVGYKPDTIDYFGYFNSNVCYVFNAGSNRFDPSVAAGGPNNKQCTGSSQWSGDFLNYLTTGRLDALRKVLYGGWRQVDQTGTTVLQGAFFPQDGHSWGKEYQSTARDGYDIARYAPLTQPAVNSYHLFAVTTVTDNSPPLLRVMQDSPHRIWNWVSIEGPVANERCFNDSNQRVNCPVGAGALPFPGHPNNRAEFDAMESTYAIASYKLGSTVNRTTLDCSTGGCNLATGQQDNFMTTATARFRMLNSPDAAGGYQFCIDGDDAVDVEIRSDNASEGLLVQTGFYGAHGFANNCDGPRQTSTMQLLQDRTYVIKVRHEEAGGGEGYRLQWRKIDGANQFGWQVFDRDNSHNNNKRSNSGGNQTEFSLDFYNLTPSATGSTRRDYAVRVLTCPTTAALREANCKQYGTGASATFKPTGILHDFGETNRMYFGLLTGSQRNNLEGGVLRRNMSSFADEVDPDTGQFRDNVDGIVRTLDRFRMIGGGYNGNVTNNTGNNANWNWANGTGNCPSIGGRAINNGECRMWGNPIGEMMFESLRYYAGAAAPTARYATGGASQGVAEETTLGLTTETWKDPYLPTADGGLGFRSCSKPVMTVISDINPSYDSDLPGSPWNSPTFTLPATISGFSAQTVGSQMWNAEFGAGARSVFIGQSGGSTDGAPTVKSASSFGTIRGLSPEEPTKEGGYGSSAVSFYGWKKSGDINARSTEKVRTYAVALASPLPIIRFPVNGRQLTFVPFAKTSGGTFGGSPQKPTNTIVDFYVETFVNLPGQPQDATINGGRPRAVFRINYEDVEQGNDHDMDAIVRYDFVANADGTVTVTLLSEYAAGSAIQHMGYIATGTTTDGVYLEVRDFDTSLANSPAYIFNTPPGRAAGYCNVNPMPSDCSGLPLVATRVFTPGGAAGAVTALKDPLWYAAKYGGFNDSNANDLPDLQSEWDSNGDGKPDNYFLVTNALTLKEELTKAFAQIERDARPSGGVAASGARKDGEFLAFVPDYNAEDWSGDVKAYPVNDDGSLGALAWSAAAQLPTPPTRKIFGMVRNGANLVARDFTVAGLGGANPLLADSAFSALGLSPLAIITQFGPTTTIFDVVDFLRGDKSKEVAQGGVFRDRSRVIGDILGSQPEVLGRGSFGYELLDAADGGGFTGAGSYGAFVNGIKKTRTAALFVGSNDGFLHGFDGRAGAGGGNELFAIAPNGTMSKMGLLADPNYSHTNFVDAPPAIGDARLGGQWKSILVSAAGAGGKSVMIVDVTNPVASFGTTNILHEIQHPEIGNVFGRARIVRAEDNRWYAILGNGINSASNQSGIALIDLQTGTVKTILTGLGSTADANGMGAIGVIDDDNNGKADTVYGGDYHGRVWKFDISAASPALWNVDLGGQPLFVAESSTGARQQITGSLDIGPHFDDGYMVLFGTGRYFQPGDGVVGVNPPIETFYGVWDDGTQVTGGRASLQTQTITTQTTVAGFGETRELTRNPIDWTTKRGWSLDLKVGATPAVGERFIGEPLVALGRVLFATFTPIGDECSPGGVNWFYALSYLTGVAQLSDSGAGALRLTPPGQSTPPATAPPVVITGGSPRSEIVGDGGGGDPTVPPLPGDPPPPTPTTPPPSVRDRICVNNLGVVTSTGIQQFATVSCGRQSWRQFD